MSDEPDYCDFMDLLEAANRIDTVNSKRANAAVQDLCFRVDYEQTMGAALDNLRKVLDRINKRTLRKP